MLQNFPTIDPQNENPFDTFIVSDEQFEHIIKSGFKLGTFDSYAPFSPYSKVCYRKAHYGVHSNIFIFITDKGIVIDKDYSYGGNIEFWSFKGYSFEDAWNNMIEVFKSWMS